jgi:hypothetical protein
MARRLLDAALLTFLVVCCFIGVFSIGSWFPALFFRKPVTLTAESAIDIPVSETIRAVWKSGLYARDSIGRIYWLDDDTILVSANNGLSQ